MLVGKDQMCYPQYEFVQGLYMKKENAAAHVRTEATELVPSFAGAFPLSH